MFDVSIKAGQARGSKNRDQGQARRGRPTSSTVVIALCYARRDWTAPDMRGEILLFSLPMW